MLGKLLRTALTLAVAIPFQAGSDAVAEDQSARKGMIFAYRWCGTCHLDPAYPALPFKTIANERAVSVEYLREHLHNPPHRMIRFDANEEELVNLYNYFMSQRK